MVTCLFTGCCVAVDVDYDVLSYCRTFITTSLYIIMYMTLCIWYLYDCMRPGIDVDHDSRHRHPESAQNLAMGRPAWRHRQRPPAFTLHWPHSGPYTVPLRVTTPAQPTQF